MNYTIIVGIAIAAIVVVSGAVYLVYRRRITHPPMASEGEPAETTKEPSEVAPEPEQPRFASLPELSSLPDSAKNNLMNAVWYQCENPSCNSTRFLDVHQIVPESNGGSNRLDNLIVLCSRCHAAVHNNEISEVELQYWILKRTERFKTQLDWPYK